MNKPSRHSLPARPSLEHLRKQAKKRVRADPSLSLAAVQHQLAGEYGFTRWAELVKTVKTQSVTDTPLQQIEAAILAGDISSIRQLLDADPALALASSESGGPLFAAARSAIPEIVKLLLKLGADPNKINSKRNTPLWFAAQSAAESAVRIEVMQALLDAGAEINRRCEDGSTALAMAAWRGPLEVVKFLLDQGAFNWLDDNAEKLPKDYAEKGSAPDKAETARLLSGLQIANPHFRAAIRAMEEGDLPRFRTLIKNHPNLATDRVPADAWDSGNYFHRPTLLHFIAENPWRTKKVPSNICTIAQVLLDAGADVNAETAAIDNPHTTLDLVVSSMPARVSGQQETLIDFLLAHGAKTDRSIEVALANDEPAAADYLFKKSAKVTIIAAAGLGLQERLRKLLTDTNPPAAVLERALSVAFKYRHWNTAELLLGRGVDLDKEIVHAGTPLHHAALANHREGCEKLLAMGARLDLKDRLWHGTPADWALHGGGHADLSQWLREQESPSGSKKHSSQN